MVFENYLMPFMPNHTKSILDYDVKIENLRPEATFFVPAETGKLKIFYPSYYQIILRIEIDRLNLFLTKNKVVNFNL